MKFRLFAALLALACLLGGCGNHPAAPKPAAAEALPAQTLPPQTAPEAEPSNPEDFVRVLDRIPTARQELPYAGTQNFTGQKIYDFSDAWLRRGTAEKLAAVSADLAQLGLSIKIWDGFRPVSAQFRLWEACPNSAYVANPETGFSSHSRGNTVDLTLVDASGTELEMPSGFDDFSEKADRDYSDCSETAAAHAQLLEILMEKHGFSGYSKEWWHFTDTNDYPVEENFCPS